MGCLLARLATFEAGTKRQHANHTATARERVQTASYHERLPVVQGAVAHSILHVAASDVQLGQHLVFVRVRKEVVGHVGAAGAGGRCCEAGDHPAAVQSAAPQHGAHLIAALAAERLQDRLAVRLARCALVVAAAVELHLPARASDLEQQLATQLHACLADAPRLVTQARLDSRQQKGQAAVWLGRRRGLA